MMMAMLSEWGKILATAQSLGFLALVSAADVRGTAVERVALMFYLFIYIGGFDPYAVGISNRARHPSRAGRGRPSSSAT